jgi:protein arginine kinase activator
LLPLLQQIHGHVEHAGRTPAGRPLDGSQRHRLGELRTALDEAVRGEDYERAALLRDEIRSLEHAPDSAAGESEGAAGKKPPQEAR